MPLIIMDIMRNNNFISCSSDLWITWESYFNNDDFSIYIKLFKSNNETVAVLKSKESQIRLNGNGILDIIFKIIIHLEKTDKDNPFLKKFSNIVKDIEKHLF